MEENILEIDNLYTLFEKSSIFNEEKPWSKIIITLRTMKLNSHHMNIIFKLLEFNKTPSLYINLENNPEVSREKLIELLEFLGKYPKLTNLSLFLSYTGFTDEETPALISLLRAHAGSLTELKIGLMGAQITDKSVADLLAAVSTLELQRVYFGIRGGVFEMSYKDLVSMCQNCKIKNINLNAMFVPKFPKNLSSLISEAAKTNDHVLNCKLNYVELKNN